MRTEEKSFSQDYREPVWRKGMREKLLIRTLIMLSVLCFFFYRSPWGILPIMPAGVYYFKVFLKESIQKQRQELLKEFHECIIAVSTSLSAGYSVENSFMLCIEDMIMLFGADSMIVKELEIIKRGMKINIPLEELLEDFAERSAIREIKEFAGTFRIARKSSGNLAHIMRKTAGVISREIETGEEVRTILQGRLYEQRIMKVMPFLMINYISLTYKGFFDDLYGNLKGFAIMTGMMIIYLLADIVGRRMMQAGGVECI